MEGMTTAPFILQPTVPAPGEAQRARIVTAPIYSNAAAALAAWETLRAGVPAHVTALRMVAAPVLDRASGPRSGLRGFRLVSDGYASVEVVKAQVESMNSAARITAATPQTLREVA